MHISITQAQDEQRQAERSVVPPVYQSMSSRRKLIPKDKVENSLHVHVHTHIHHTHTQTHTKEIRKWHKSLFPGPTTRLERTKSESTIPIARHAWSTLILKAEESAFLTKSFWTQELLSLSSLSLATTHFPVIHRGLLFYWILLYGTNKTRIEQSHVFLRESRKICPDTKQNRLQVENLREMCNLVLQKCSSILIVDSEHPCFSSLSPKNSH